jgi:aryl-alcohol dehydrogenase-like predicted oxidoreductase
MHGDGGRVATMAEKKNELELADELDQLAEAEARGETEGPALHAPARPASQVYSLRLPLHAADHLQQLADRDGVTPGVLVRQWVLQRLGVATASESAAVSKEQATDLFREALDRAARETLADFARAIQPREGVNIGSERGANIGRRLVTVQHKERPTA